MVFFFFFIMVLIETKTQHLEGGNFFFLNLETRPAQPDVD